jgi:hypothetical protein
VKNITKPDVGGLRFPAPLAPPFFLAKFRQKKKLNISDFGVFQLPQVRRKN